MTDLQSLVDTLSSLDDESAVTVITSVLQARPELAPSVVNFAVPNLTYPPSKVLVERRASGRVKSVNLEKGFGFIECAELQQVFGNDVFVHAKQIGQFQVGTMVSFAVVLNKDMKPQAYDIVEASVQEAWSGGGAGWGSDKGMGKMGGDKGMGKMSMMAQMMQAKGMGPNKGMSMMGAMMGKGKGKAKGACGACGGCGGCGGCGAYSACGACGQSEGDFTGWGNGNNSSSSAMSPMGAMSAMGAMKGGGFFGGKGPIVVAELGTLCGTIKSFNAEKGYGFIHCPTLLQVGYNDVFLHHQQIGDFEVGNEVSFSCFLNPKGQPQAKDLSGELVEEVYDLSQLTAKRQKLDLGF